MHVFPNGHSGRARQPDARPYRAQTPMPAATGCGAGCPGGHKKRVAVMNFGLRHSANNGHEDFGRTRMWAGAQDMLVGKNFVKRRISPRWIRSARNWTKILKRNRIFRTATEAMQTPRPKWGGVVTWSDDHRVDSRIGRDDPQTQTLGC